MDTQEKKPRHPSETPHIEDLCAFQNVQAFLKQQLERLTPDSLLTQCWDRFYETHTAILHQLARIYHVPPDEIDDLVQEVWVEVVTHLQRFLWNENRPGLRNWLVTIVRAKAASLFRYKARHPVQRLDDAVVAEPESAPLEADLAALFESRWQNEMLQSALADLRAHLSEQNIRVLELRCLEGRSVAEVAELLGWTSEQVWSRQHWLMQKLRARMHLYCGQEFGPAH